MIPNINQDELLSLIDKYSLRFVIARFDENEIQREIDLIKNNNEYMKMVEQECSIETEEDLKANTLIFAISSKT